MQSWNLEVNVAKAFLESSSKSVSLVFARDNTKSTTLAGRSDDVVSDGVAASSGYDVLALSDHARRSCT